MKLYDLILQYERRQSEEILRRTLDRSLLIRICTGSKEKKIVDWDILKSQVVLDAAYKLSNLKASEKDLDTLVNKLNQIDYHEFGLETSDPELLNSRKDWILLKIEFYKQYAWLKEDFKSYEEAVKKRFQTESSYREALQPLFASEKKMYEILSKSAPLISSLLNAVIKTANEVREESIRKIFQE